MKIAYVYSAMTNPGGTERMITEKANYLSGIYGYDITIITCFQAADEKNYFELSPKIKQIYLEIPFSTQYKYKYPKRLWIKGKLNWLLKKDIKRVVSQVDPDILIGVSRFKADFISSLKCRAKKIIECHETRYNTNYDPSVKQIVPVRLFMPIYRRLYFIAIERNADAVVTLTKKDKLLWKRAKRIEAIPNFSTIPVSRCSDCTQKRVIAVGRLDWEKGFERLIEAWGIVSSRFPDWHLDIYGNGHMYDTLTTMVLTYHANNLTIHNSSPNISQEYSMSSICAVTSYFEGFSLVLLEALKHGLPCVAFDCPFGPGDIIDDGKEGFLVENGDIRLFAERICRLIEDEDLRKHLSKNAIERAKLFNIEVIMNQWKTLFEDIIKLS